MTFYQEPEPMDRGRVMLIEDRYDGIYTCGTWLGVIDADHRHQGASRGAYSALDGPSDGDIGAAAF